MSAAATILALVTLQRLGELLLSGRNTKRLISRGAIEVGGSHYPVLVALHASFLMALWVLGNRQPVNWLALAAFMALQGLRLSTLVSLGSRFTTRIIVLPGEPLVTSGPYRYLSHPNYAVVVGEIALLPLALNLPWLALIFSLVNAFVLLVRIRIEARALSSLSRPQPRAAK